MPSLTWNIEAPVKENFLPVAAVPSPQAPVLVPEPSTYALLIAGLGLTYFASRRRKR